MLAVQSRRSSFMQRLSQHLRKRLPLCLTGTMTVNQMLRNKSPLFRFYASEAPLYGFKPLRPQLNRVMSRLGFMTGIMVKSARAKHLESFKGQRKIVCLTAYSPPITRAFDPHCDLQIGASAAVAAFHKAVANETFPLEQRPFWPKKLTGLHL